MNDRTIQEYFKQSIRIVKSCVFKIDENYVNFSFHNYVKYNRKPPKRIDSKYYLNLTGQRTEFDPVVYVLSPLLGEYIPLTKSVLDSDSLLRSIIRKYDKEYDTVIDKYPTMKTYIDGCCVENNFTISELITDIENYTLLDIEKSFINDYEITIVKDLETFVNKFFNRWFNKGYMIDEYYLPGFLNNLYHGLILYLLFVKLKNILTHKVDDFHLVNFLASYKNLDKYVTIFDRETKLWLYGNLRRLKRYLGFNSTLEELFENVWERNKYGIGEFIYHNKKNKINETALKNENKNIPLFERDYSYTTEKKNESFYKLDGRTYDVYETNNILKNNGTIPDFYKLNDRSDNFLSKLENITESYTKNFILDSPEKIKKYSTNLLVTVTSNLLYILRSESYRLNELDYVNKSNGKIYKLNAKDIYNLLIYGLYKLAGKINNNFTLVLYGVFEFPDKEKALQNTWHKDKIETIFDFIFTSGLKIETFKNCYIIKKWMQELKELEPKVWYLISNIPDTTINIDIISLLNQSFKTELISVSIDKVKQELELRNLNSFFNNNNVYEIFIDLLGTTTGIDLEPYKKILEIYDKAKGFFAKTTSYSIILLTDYNYKDVVISNNLKPGINLGYKPMIEVKKGSWERHEIWPSDLHTSTYNQNLDYKNDHIPKLVSSALDIENFLYYRLDNIKNEPHALVYAKRFGGKEYTPTLDTLTFKDNELVFDQKDKQVNISILQEPKNNNVVLASILNNRNISNVYGLGKYTKHYIIPNKHSYGFDIEDNINKYNTKKPSTKIVNDKSKQSLYVKYDKVNNNTLLTPSYGYPKSYTVTQTSTSVSVSDIDTLNIKDTTILLTPKDITDNPKVKYNILHITDNNKEIIYDKLGKYTKEYSVESNKPIATDIEKDNINKVERNRITKIAQNSNLHVNNKTDYITDELDPWYTEKGYPLETKLVYVDNNVVDNNVNIKEVNRSKLDAGILTTTPSIKMSMLVEDTNKFFISDNYGKYLQNYKPKMKELTFVPQSDKDIAEIKKEKRYYSVGVNNPQTLITNVDEVNDYSAISSKLGYNKTYTNNITTTSDNSNIDNVSVNKNKTISTDINNPDTIAKTDEVDKN